MLVGNAFIVYGGDTKIDETDILDETLYLLNTCTLPMHPWKPPSPPRPILTIPQQPDNGPERYLLDRAPLVDMVIP